MKRYLIAPLFLLLLASAAWADVTVYGSGKLNSVIFNTAEYTNTACSSSRTVDWNNGNKQALTLTGSCAITFTAPTSGVGNLTLRLVQGGSGSYTVSSWASSPKWPAGTAPTLTTAVGSVDIISCYYSGAAYYCQAGGDFR